MQPALLLVLLFGMVDPLPPAQQRDGASAAGGGPPAVRTLLEWVTAVSEHAPGALDGAAERIASWPDADLEGAVAGLEDLARFLARAHERRLRSGTPPLHRFRGATLSPDDVGRLLGLTEAEVRSGDVTRFARRAVLLHTDIAILARPYSHGPSGVSSGAASRPSALLVMDGQQLGVVRRAPHWELARALADLFGAADGARDAKRRWYIATAAYMSSRALVSDLQPHLARGLQLFPGDPALLLLTGCMHEKLAAPHVQQALQQVAATPGVKLSVTTARTHLLEARAAFARALDAEPGLAEARVRHGRVLGLLGRDEEAVPQLERAYRDATSKEMGYYAALLLGGARVRLGALDEARDAFSRAAALYPRAQAPRVALSALMRRAGDLTGARAALLEVLTTRPDDPARYDPWWEYFIRPEEESAALLQEWRAAAAPETSR